MAASRAHACRIGVASTTLNSVSLPMVQQGLASLQTAGQVRRSGALALALQQGAFPSHEDAVVSGSKAEAAEAAGSVFHPYRALSGVLSLPTLQAYVVAPERQLRVNILGAG